MRSDTAPMLLLRLLISCEKVKMRDRELRVFVDFLNSWFFRLGFENGSNRWILKLKCNFASDSHVNKSFKKYPLIADFDKLTDYLSIRPLSSEITELHSLMLSHVTINQLKNILADKGLPTKGLKAQLKVRLKEAIIQTQPSS